MRSIEEIRDEVMSMEDILDSKTVFHILQYIELLKNKQDFVWTIENILSLLREDFYYRDTFTQSVFMKWDKEISSLLNLPGLWTQRRFEPWDELVSLNKVLVVYGGLDDVNRSLYSKIVIPETIISINPRAFINCVGLKEIILPETILSIGSNAFTNCRELTKLKIPQSVRHIDGEIITACHSLEVLEVPAKFKDWEAKNPFFRGHLKTKIEYY